MTRNYKLLLPLASLTLLAIGSFTSTLHADIVFSNMKAACGYGILVVGQNSGNPTSLAEAFTPDANDSLTEAEARLNGVFEGLFTVNAPAPLGLTANVPYWLVLSPGTASTDVIWEEIDPALCRAHTFITAPALGRALGLSPRNFRLTARRLSLQCPSRKARHFCSPSSASPACCARSAADTYEYEYLCSRLA